MVWITCGLLRCFYQLFELSFWRHPFTAVHPLVSKRYNAKCCVCFVLRVHTVFVFFCFCSCLNWFWNKTGSITPTLGLFLVWLQLTFWVKIGFRNELTVKLMSVYLCVHSADFQTSIWISDITPSTSKADLHLQHMTDSGWSIFITLQITAPYAVTISFQEEKLYNQTSCNRMALVICLCKRQYPC